MYSCDGKAEFSAASLQCHVILQLICYSYLFLLMLKKVVLNIFVENLIIVYTHTKEIIIIFFF